MKKPHSRLYLFSAYIIAGSTIASISSVTQAAELAQNSPDILSSSSAPNIDRVLIELSRQHNNAPSLVKEARQPVSLAVQSPLLTKDSSIATNDEDVLERLTAVASNSVSKFKQTGLASWYGRKFHGRKTASGETFNMNAMTAAHRSLPFNCYVKVTNKSNGQSVVVKVNDRGPFHGNRVLDLSYGAAKQIGLTQSGTSNVTIERVSGP